MDLRPMKLDFSLDSLQLKLVAFCVIACVAAMACNSTTTAGYSSVPGVDSQKVALAREFINPNTDPYASLRRLPGVGDVRALEIIGYREACKNPPAFRKPQDLTKVSGIGQGTLRDAEPMMKLD